MSLMFTFYQVLFTYQFSPKTYGSQAIFNPLHWRAPGILTQRDLFFSTHLNTEKSHKLSFLKYIRFTWSITFIQFFKMTKLLEITASVITYVLDCRVVRFLTAKPTIVQYNITWSNLLTLGYRDLWFPLLCSKYLVKDSDSAFFYFFTSSHPF